MYRVSKTFKFTAHHKLVAPYRGPCSRKHAHEWTVQFVCKSELLDPCGMVMDFAKFDGVVDYCNRKFGNAMINDTVEQPTAENIARHIYERFKTYNLSIEFVRVYESADCYGEYGRC